MAHTVEFDTDSMIGQILKDFPRDTPIITINLLKYKAVAEYKAGEDGETMPRVSGAEAYAQRYLPVSRTVLQTSGAQFEVIYKGSMVSHLIGPSKDEWDEILMLRYPNREELLKLVGSPDFAKGKHHRTAALSNSRLMISQETLKSL